MGPVTDTALLILCVNGKEMKRVEFNSALSELFVHNRGDFYIFKSGKKIIFCFGGLYDFNIPEIEKMEAKTVSVFIGQRDNYPVIPKMYLNYLVFRKDKVKTWLDIPNRYPSGSIVTIDGKSRKVYMDGIQRQRMKCVEASILMSHREKRKYSSTTQIFVAHRQRLQQKYRRHIYNGKY